MAADVRGAALGHHPRHNGVDHEPHLPHPTPVQAQTYRDLLFLVAGIPIAAVVLGLVIAGWTSIAVLAITPLVVPCCSATEAPSDCSPAATPRWRGRCSARPPARRSASSGRGFWGRAKAVFLDPTFWRQQAYLLLRMTLGFALAVGELSLIAGALGWITLPIWYRWTDTQYGSWHVDTLGRALAVRARPGSSCSSSPAWLARGARIAARRGRCARCSRHAPRRPRPRAAAGTGGGRSGSTPALAAGLVLADDHHLGGDRRRLLLAGVGAAPARRCCSRSTRWSSWSTEAQAPAGAHPWPRDPRRRRRGDLRLPVADLGGDRARATSGRPGSLLGLVDTARRPHLITPRQRARPPRPPRRDARDDPPRRRRGAGRRAPPHRARPARRRAGAARRARA